jgi:hypothetical protein
VCVCVCVCVHVIDQVYNLSEKKGIPHV